MSPWGTDGLIENWCKRLAEAFGRIFKPGLVRIWQDRLKHVDEPTLQKGFHHIEGHDEKFPSVSRLLEVMRIVGFKEKTPFYPEAVDKNGVKCWVDTENGDYLYRAVDCPEGRKFLEKFAELAKKKSA